MKRLFLLSLFACCTTASVQAQQSFPNRGTDRRYPPAQRPPDRNRCNGNCACGGQAFYNQPMPDNPFQQALQQIASESFEADKLRTATYIAETSYLQTKQIVALAKLFDSNATRKDFLIAAYPACLDKEMYFMAVNTLDFSSDRKKAWERIDQLRKTTKI